MSKAAKPTLRMVKASELGPLMEPDEVAKLLRIARFTVMKWARDGVLTCVKLSERTILFKKSDVEELIASLTVSGTNEKRRRKFKR